jgi:hypothetical protein
MKNEAAYNIKYRIMIKGKVFPFALTEHHAMKAHWGSGGIDPCIFDLYTR